MTQAPYRAPDPPPAAPPPSRFFCTWDDAGRQTNVYMAYYAVAASLIVLLVVGSWSRMGALALLATLLAVVLWRRRHPGTPRGLSLRVENGVLGYLPEGARVETWIPLASVRNVELDSKAIQRVTYHQAVGAAMPSSQVSNAVDISRIVLVLDPPESPVPLSRTYASYSLCIERYGKLRLFLRGHGWLPEDERRG